MKRILLITLSFAFLGCSSTPKNDGPWAASVSYDRFTDDVECFVSTGDFFSETRVYTSSNKYYPFVQIKNGVLLVGVRSGGQYKVPVGDVRFRIDGNQAVDISISETPLDKQVNPMVDAMKANYASLPEDQRKMISDAYDNASKYSQAVASPITASTGEKAKALLEQLKQGRKLIYQAGIFPNMPVMKSTVGEVVINESFKKALEQCNIR